MVEGLLMGLARRFGQRIELTHTAQRDAASPEDRFLIRIMS
jgi:hypothetical protein